ncbi:two component transcriptional regulator [Psychromonas sp. CNPT3]|uniref:LytR/AlgR family response regulator transcription factor n=1 Tax=Psychromonas sp. CNPT3 TaxID=314282 RepID=UPI00006E9E3B|nr:LytTR family DNA-binding domain-containing protein [Psychromonas sp. CNPT3]AGH80913.1 two component transcriptional regulator [Psychromonas sp. CNPT3]
MLSALIVEDEYLAQEELIYLIEKHSQIKIKACFEDGLEAFKFLQTQRVDIVFLDINIPSIDGMLLAKNIHQFSQKPQIVFTTACKDFAVDAFALEAFDYLLKPLSEQRVMGVLQKLERQQQSSPSAEVSLPFSAKTLNLYHNNRIFITPFNDICYALANDKITHVFTEKGEFTVPFTLNELMNRLPNDDFFRVHRSYCVNLQKIQEIIPWVNSTYMLKLSTISTKIPVSRGNLKTFKALMNL